MNRTREQQLVDICFQLTITAAKYMRSKSNEDIAKWVASQLDACGFYTEPMGMSWGVLRDKPKVKEPEWLTIEPNRPD